MHRFLLAFCLSLCTAAAHAQTRPAPEKIAPELWRAALQDGSATAIVELAPQADLSGARLLRTKAEKAQFVFEALRAATDNAPQRELLRWLEQQGLAYRAFTLVNALLVTAPLPQLEALAQFDVVRRLHADPPVRSPEPIRSAPTDLRGAAPMLAWGISFIRADSVWALGYAGQGVLIGGQDTGYDWDHLALRESYAGWDGAAADHNYHWHDAIHSLSPLNNDTTQLPTNNPCGLDVLEPCDDGSHGTHTMGTMAGAQDTFGNPVGVAPQARWMGCRNMERGWGSPSTYLECFEFFLAPTDLAGQNPDPLRAPHVINNSWSCPPIEGCDPSNYAFMEQAIENLRTAGVVVVVSAGNEGPGCNTLISPPTFFDGSFSVGASDFMGQIAGFSSRGSVLADSSNRLKPNITAPGVGVYSCTPGDNFNFNSGTSMAGPHVAGLVALLISANPDLAGQVEAIETIIEQSATPAFDTVDCGGVPGTSHPNNTFGWGIIDAVRAVEAALQWTGLEAAPQGQPSVLVAAPNPFGETLRITLRAGATPPQSIMVCDVLGRVVFRQDRPQFPLNIPAQQWPAGMYWVGSEKAQGVVAVKSW